MRSIERTLLGWILGALLLGATLVVLVTYLVTLEEMREVFDADLKSVARAAAHYREAAGSAAMATRPGPAASSDDSEIVMLARDAAGDLVFTSDPRIPIPRTGKEGWSRAVLDGQEWIVYTVASSSGLAQAAQRVASREEMAAESAAKIIPPLVGLTTIVAVLLVYGLRRGLQPLEATADDVARRSADTLEAIDDRAVPREFAPIVRSINGLMARLGAALSTQRRFIADAAHELRTPLTALRLQLQLLQGAGSGQREQAMAELALGIDRTQRLVEQLLQVARCEPDGAPPQLEPVDLSALARAVVSALSTRAEHAGLDLGADGPDRIVVAADPAELTVLLNNLVENAIRYTPSGGVIDVTTRIEGHRAVLRVVDDGPGILPEDRQRVFERFYRCAGSDALARDGGGSGLGLAIVQAIAQRHQAQVSLHASAGGRGLEVRVVFDPPSQPFHALELARPASR